MGPEQIDRGRRRFLNWLLTTAFAALGAAVAYPIARFISPPRVPEATTDRIEAGSVNDPELLGRGFKIVRFGQEPVIVIRLSAQDVRAFSATCTHLQCIVEFQKDKSRIWCNCHNGEYNLEGINVAGPPPRPLSRFDVNLVSSGAGQPEQIVVTRS